MGPDPVTLHNASDVTARRQQLINFVWGTAGFPTRSSVGVAPNSWGPAAPGIRGLENLGRVDTLTVSEDAGQSGLGHHLVPATRANGRLMVVHHGHACTFDDDPSINDAGSGMQRTINNLLVEGYAVLAVYMPHLRPDDCTGNHNAMFNINLPTGSPMKFFLEPVAVMLNYLQSSYSDVSMTGLSGGGWTTTVYAAIDPRVRLSLPVAGSIAHSVEVAGDLEQTLPAFYAIAGYPDLYVLGSTGFGRRQVQILNRRDECCFGQAQYQGSRTWDVDVRAYEVDVRTTLFQINSGFFRVEIDEAAPAHMISWNAVTNVILAELNQGRRFVGAASSGDAFVRGLNGDLWHFSASAGWEDTGFAMAGIASVVSGAINTFDVFYRNGSNRLTRASYRTGTWSQTDLGGVLITDPTAITWGPGRIDIVALGRDYQPYHWINTSGGTTVEGTVSGSRGLGPVALIHTTSSGTLDIFVRGFDRNIYQLQSNGSAPWTQSAVGGIISDFPAAIVSAQGQRLVFGRGRSGGLWLYTQSAGGWRPPTQLPTGTTTFTGTPSVASAAGTVYLQALTSDRYLGTLTLPPGGSWTLRINNGLFTGSPTATGSVAHLRGRSGGLWLVDGPTRTNRGGLFD